MHLHFHHHHVNRNVLSVKWAYLTYHQGMKYVDPIIENIQILVHCYVQVVIIQGWLNNVRENVLVIEIHVLDIAMMNLFQYVEQMA